MRVSKIELVEVGPFVDVVFEIPPPAVGRGEIVLFEGPNGCGKSTIVEAIAAACDKTHGEPLLRLRSKALTQGSASNVWLSHDGATEWTRRDLRGASVSGHRITLAPSPVRERLESFRLGMLQVDARVEWAAFAYRPHAESPSVGVLGPKNIEWPALNGAVSMLSGTTTDGTDPLKQALPARGFFGQLLANLESARTRALVYAAERASEPDGIDYAELARGLRASIAGIEHALSRFLDRAVKISFSVEQQSARISFDGKDIPIEQLGEGMRSSIAWLADLLVRLERTNWADKSRSHFEQDFWLILDEIDESLHPTMQARVYPTLRELFPNACIYATTHSPFVVASLGEGVIFPIRPDMKTRRVEGAIEARALTPGRSLELVVTDIFQAHAGIVDESTRMALQDHQRDVDRVRKKRDIDWRVFGARRERLSALNDEVRTLVAMTEYSIRAEIERRAALPPETGP